MGRMVRVLLKIPAVRRVMVRLANQESATQEQEGRLGAMASTLSGQDASLAGLNERLSEGLSGLGGRLDGLNDSNEQLGQRLDEANALHDGTIARLEGFKSVVERLNLGQDEQRRLVAEIAQHMPPDRRTALEGQVHALNTMFGALNAATQANQQQLAVLSERIAASAPTADVASLQQAVQELAAQVQRFGTESRLLKAGVGNEGEAQRPIPPLSYRDLVDGRADLRKLRNVFHVHVPKAAGNSVYALMLQNNFIPLDFDMDRRTFFHTVSEQAWRATLEQHGPRRNFFFTGHFRFDAAMLKTMWAPHVIIALLREPTKRALSHYNYTRVRPGNPHHDEVRSGKMSFLDYAEWLVSAGSVGPQYSFFDDTGGGSFAYSGTASAGQCLDNLLGKVSLYGFADRFDEFGALFGFLLRRSNIVVRSRNETSEANIEGTALKHDVTDHERAVLSKLYADDIWFYQAARDEYEQRISEPRVKAMLENSLPLICRAREDMNVLAGVPDPGDAGASAFFLPQLAD